MKKKTQTTQNVTKLKNSKCDKTQKLKLSQNSKTQIVTKLKKASYDKIQFVTKLNWWQTSIDDFKSLLVRITWHLDNRWHVLWAAFRDLVMFLKTCKKAVKHFELVISRCWGGSSMISGREKDEWRSESTTFTWYRTRWRYVWLQLYSPAYLFPHLLQSRSC